MNRRQTYTAEIDRSYDELKGWRDSALGLGFAISDIAAWGQGSGSSLGVQSILSIDGTGARTGISTGLRSSATAVAALLSGFSEVTFPTYGVTFSDGSVYVICDCDNVGNVLNNGGTPTGYGDIAADSTLGIIQCRVLSQTVTIPGAPPSGSNILWYLITVTPQVVDTTESDDPSLFSPNPNAVLPFYNSANPKVPLGGPGGTNPATESPTVRKATGTLNIATATNTSTSAPPTSLVVPSTDVPLAMGYLTSSDITINSAHFWYCGLGTAPALTGAAPVAGNVAPFMRGLQSQHHLGVAGSAPQIDGAKEWLPLGPVPMASQKFTGMGDGSASGDSVAWDQFQSALAADANFAAQTGCSATATAANLDTSKTPGGPTRQAFILTLNVSGTFFGAGAVTNVNNAVPGLDLANFAKAKVFITPAVGLNFVITKALMASNSAMDFSVYNLDGAAHGGTVPFNVEIIGGD